MSKENGGREPDNLNPYHIESTYRSAGTEGHQGDESPGQPKSKAPPTKKLQQGCLGCLGILGVLIVLGMLLGKPPNNQISRAEFGEQWPFTVEEGELECQVLERAGRKLHAVTFKTGGRTYAINGSALTWQLGEDIRTSDIWAADRSDVLMKKNIGPVIDRGLSMCP